MPRAIVNGRSVESNGTILSALRQLQIEVPTLCHDDRLKPYGGCRLCVVEIKGTSRLISACATPLAEGMDILTHSPKVEAQRRTMLRLLAKDYPATEGLVESIPFHKYLRQYGLEPSGSSRKGFKDFTHPYLRIDLDKCVHCYRCVRICDEVQGQFVWRVWNRGDQTVILPDKGASMLESSCVSCGACADTCPSGAIQDRAVVDHGVPTSWTKTTCPYCGTGCEIELGTRDDRVVVAKPVLEAPVNKGHLCVKGRYAHAFVHAEDRATTPLLRTDQGWKETTWDQALQMVADRFSEVLSEHGPGAMGVLGSARATNEENYLAQKFARVVLRSNNVDCCARVCHGPTAAALKATLGTGAATNSFNDIEAAQGFLICGANPTENHPVVGARIKQAVLNGAKLVVIDPRKTELARLADVHVQIKPGTNIPVLHAIANSIISEGLADRHFIEARTSDFDRFSEFVRQWTPDRAAEICGVSAEIIRKAASVYAGCGAAMIFHGLGMTEHSQGTEGIRCLANLALLTGNVGKPGTGENPLRGQNNVQGSAHMGCEPSNLAGYTPIETAAELFETVWGVRVPREKGLNWMEMSDAAGRGSLKALWCIGYDVYFSNPNAGQTGLNLSNLDFLVVQDLFLNETAKRYAHVFLPACSSYEKNGTFMNSERRVQRVRQAISSQGDSKPDWKIICELAEKMGFQAQFQFQSPREIWDEVRRVWKAGAGISYERLEICGLQWPCVSDEDPGTTILHSTSFPMGDRAAFSLIQYRPTPERTCSEFPFLLSTGRTLHQFNAGTMTMRTPNVELHPTDFLDISPKDALRIGIESGDYVRLASKYGSTTLTARINEGIREGELFTTFHDPKVFVNRITGSNRDGVVGTPEYKITAVRIDPV